MPKYFILFLMILASWLFVFIIFSMVDIIEYPTPEPLQSKVSTRCEWAIGKKETMSVPCTVITTKLARVDL